ncbi:hypothetical protein MMC30_002384 [Trapelia coarctata]|nr:hypothetical protein [Trapelia coarctata]
MVLENLDKNLLDESNSKRLKISEIKYVARHILEALAALHENNIIHADMKPDNVLVNPSDGSTRFTTVKLADFGDSMHVDDIEEGHLVGAPIFRSPEGMLNLRWGTATDIWSFGTTLISLLWGHNFHLFKPKSIDCDNPSYSARVFIKQDTFFGPFPASFKEALDADRRGIVELNESYVEERTHFSRTGPPEIAVEDRDFILKIMKMDPRDRPSAKDLLQDEWFSM